ncbi:YozE family protein [Ralstonia pseudosolanacearum]|uniref:YozE family protein n=1 Tax=Ralstonia pseudosolanacearum TaxID=1310165 RepID=UPI002675ECE0|nr:YozE family protein [Ralstonia pseudosolanacearum]MDO3510588.1 YozE family protein [Ralstonia pseudosolanacearum]MDO3629609.1 YozE family protein [Ralstonia pseudosolanacearum]
MNHAISTAQLEQLRRDAKRLARQKSIPLHQAQDSIAAERGFKNWSLLAKDVAAPVRGSQPVLASSFVDPRRRYHLHGDQEEGDSSRYYCAMCDVFFSAEHFEREHDKTKSVERYLQGVRTWASRSAADPHKWHRPKDAFNLFSAALKDYNAAQAAREASRSAFHRWIVMQTGRNDWMGDLAQDIKFDKDFPVAETSLDALLRYMAGEGAVDAALAAMRDAYAEFSATQ